MKVHYINILLFSLPLNILEHNPWNHYMKPHTYTNRSLCECDLYMPNYDKDPQMKEVMENFNKQTQQRFHEYDERMKTTRQKCKDQCDKEIQKIILKDKLEKELMDKFATLHTDMQSDAIPTCVCEKSIADKVEKNCMKCTQNLGGIVAPSSGVLAGIAEGALYAWKPTAIAAAMELAKQAGAAAGLKAGDIHGMNIVIYYLKDWGVDELIPEIYKTFVATNRYTELANIAGDIIKKHAQNCADSVLKNPAMCEKIGIKFGLMDRVTLSPKGPPASESVPKVINQLVGQATQGANAKAAMVASDKTLAVETAKKNAIETTFMGYHNAIIASIVAIIVIVLIMVIIYLILRYRRKKKMKKKLQYIKLLEE
ncbi:rifin [Plasmodium falciparum Dd2]|uniref:Rifin n=1 Tax=Plasmodium falciparum (isolate Dd2) TaxID=57267 RepID=A0A0L7LVV4_PLAF4|nr:rifin [Plasmodium falciparum Dd2]